VQGVCPGFFVYNPQFIENLPVSWDSESWQAPP